MPLARIKPRVDEATDPVRMRTRSRPPRKLRVSAFALAVLMAISVVACSEGTANEAKQAESDDAKRTSVVDYVQATESAGFVRNPATPTPDATTTSQ